MLYIKRPQILFFIFVFTSLVFPQPRFDSSESLDTNTYIPKKGGICFRVDDNALISDYRIYADIFNKYSKKFTFALNFGMDEFNNPNYRDSIAVFQNMGHELMDHTPDHRTNFFDTKFDPSEYTTLKGVDHVISNKICLKYKDVDTTKSKRSGICDINNDLITGDFSNLEDIDRFLYFPELSKLVFIDNIIDDNNLHISDAWRDDIDLGIHSNIKFFSFDLFGVRQTTDAYEILGNETLKLANLYNLDRPYTWIQPGGKFPQLHKEDLKASYGNRLGFLAGAVYPDDAEQVFNEYNPANNFNFAMQWGDFIEDEWTLEQCKKEIAASVAKNYMLIGHSHFYDAVGGLSQYFERVDSILAWSVRKNIPVYTYTELADLLYVKTPNPYENSIPQMNIDFDENGTPDGYETDYGTWEINDGPPDSTNSCYSIDNNDYMFSINYLGGIEKGINDFEIWTKGAPGNFVSVTFRWNHQNQFEYTFPAESLDWKLYSLKQATNFNSPLVVPDSISIITIFVRCINHTSGNVKVGGLWLSKPKLKLNSKIFLQGSYIGNNLMSTSLNTSGLLPLNHPFNIAPWNYKGNESVNIIPNSNIVDWILVELRDKTNPTIIKSTRAAFILNNGNIVDIDGVSPLSFYLESDNFYVVIKHRNHLPVMSANPIHLATSQLTHYNFTTNN